jgi:hypothetical protein
MPQKIATTSADADVIALKCLSFLAEDGERLGRFLTLSGVSPESLRRDLGEPSFLAGVLDYVLGDEALLVAFSESAALKPEAVVSARRKLPGAASC